LWLAERVINADGFGSSGSTSPVDEDSFPSTDTEGVLWGLAALLAMMLLLCGEVQDDADKVDDEGETVDEERKVGVAVEEEADVFDVKAVDDVIGDTAAADKGALAIGERTTAAEEDVTAPLAAVAVEEEAVGLAR